jgi:hypothetical protein
MHRLPWPMFQCAQELRPAAARPIAAAARPSLTAAQAGVHGFA